MLTTVGSLGYGGQHLNDVLAKILIELQGLTESGPLAGATANTAIAVPDNGGIDVQDTLVKVLGYNAGTFTSYTTQPTNAYASGTLTLAGVVPGDNVSVNGSVYTAVAFAINGEVVEGDGKQGENTSQDFAPYTFGVGANDTETAANLALAILANGQLPEDLNDGVAAPIGVTATSAATVVTVTANQYGTAGNSIALSAAASNGHVTTSGATLSGGGVTAAQATIASLYAKGTLTLNGIVAGDKVSVNGVVYTFVANTFNNSNSPAPGQVPVGATDTASALNLANAILGADPTLTASASSTVVTIQSRTEGTAGNSVALSAAASNGHATASGSTLAGGGTTNAILINTSTAGSQLFVHWFKKDRNLLQP